MFLSHAGHLNPTCALWDNNKPNPLTTQSVFKSKTAGLLSLSLGLVLSVLLKPPELAVAPMIAPLFPPVCPVKTHGHNSCEGREENVEGRIRDGEFTQWKYSPLHQDLHQAQYCPQISTSLSQYLSQSSLETLFISIYSVLGTLVVMGVWNFLEVSKKFQRKMPIIIAPNSNLPNRSPDETVFISILRRISKWTGRGRQKMWWVLMAGR